MFFGPRLALDWTTISDAAYIIDTIAISHCIIRMVAIAHILAILVVSLLFPLILHMSLAI